MVAEIKDFQVTETRKLASVRTVDSVEPILGADAIELAVLGGWKVVTKKGEFKPGDLAVYFEIDSFLPAGEAAWQFLVDKQSREQNGVVGHRLRTIKLRGQISQGLILPISAFASRFEGSAFSVGQEASEFFSDGANLTDFLGIVKWDPPLPAQLVGQAEGLFPSFIQKTDQERCQNIVPEIFQCEDVLIEFSIENIPLEAASAMRDRGEIVWNEATSKWQKVLKAKTTSDARYEVTMKMDGSSATFFHRNGDVGVCSRNLQLKTNDENKDNSFVRALFDNGLNWALPKYGNIAIQGELMGPNIQGNREQLKSFTVFVFDIQLLDEGRKATPAERYEIMADLYDRGVNPHTFQHSPIMVQPNVFVTDVRELPADFSGFTLSELGIADVKDLLAFAEGKSLVNAVREGLVFKKLDGRFSFKAISNKYLEKEKD